MSEFSVGKVIRSSAWLYIGYLAYSILAYMFWIIASIFVEPSVIGSAAAVLAMQSLLLVIFSLGLPMGLRRFIGMTKGSSDYQLLSSYFFTSIAFLFILNLPLTLVLFFISFSVGSIFSLTSLHLFFVALLLILNFWPPLFTSLMDSVLKTKVSVIASLLGSSVKLVLCYFFLSIGFGFLGLMIAFVCGSIGDLILLIYARKLFRTKNVTFSLDRSYLVDLLKGGLPNWFPSMLTILAQTVGILSIFGAIGGFDTGLYHIASAIAAIIYTLSTSILNILFPVLSSMDDGRKRAASRATRLSLALAAPVAILLALYPFVILSLLGPSYVQAGTLLSILVLGAAISPISAGYISYIYAVGSYSHVASIGLGSTACRLFLYMILIIPLGATGVAIAYALGEVVSLVLIVPSSYRSGYRPSWKKYLETLLIPTSLAVFLVFLSVHWIIGVPILLILSLVAYTRLGVITKTDINDISQAFLSKERIDSMKKYAKPFLRVMYGNSTSK